MPIKPFKQNILESLFDCVISYSKLLPFLFKIQSSDFIYRKEYNIVFHKNNFLHLTGVKTKLTPLEFYQSTFDKTLTMEEFDCDSNSSLKGTVREKVKHLKTIDLFFDDCKFIQERFIKGKISCLIASSNDKFTIGFTGGFNLSPMTLLNKNQIGEKDCIHNFKIKKIRI